MTKKKKAQEDGDPERPEARVFFRTVHEIKASVATSFAKQAAEALERPEEDLRPLFLDAIGQAFFQLFGTIDGVGGPGDFPRVELTLEDGDSLNGNFLHDLYVEYEPADQAKVIEQVEERRSKDEAVVLDEKQALAMLNAFRKMPALNVDRHDFYLKTTQGPAKRRKPKRKGK